MAARLRARAAPGGRAADGLDLVRRHETAAHVALRQQGRRDRLLRAQGDCLPGDRAQGFEAAAGGLRRQFRLQARRALDALGPKNFSVAPWPGLSRPSTPCLAAAPKTWMAGTRPGMTDPRLLCRAGRYR